jgi:hypothetical protein
MVSGPCGSFKILCLHAHEQGQILPQEDASHLLSFLLAYLPLRITLVDSEGDGLEVTIRPRVVDRAA